MLFRHSRKLVVVCLGNEQILPILHMIRTGWNSNTIQRILCLIDKLKLMFYAVNLSPFLLNLLRQLLCCLKEECLTIERDKTLYTLSGLNHVIW